MTFNQMPAPGQNIRRAGGTSPSAPNPARRHPLRPQDIALAASAGLPELPVPAGFGSASSSPATNWCSPVSHLPPGAIYNSNRYALRALLEGLGCEVRDLGRFPTASTRPARRSAGRPPTTT